jgi:hypothetical protein
MGTIMTTAMPIIRKISIEDLLWQIAELKSAIHENLMPFPFAMLGGDYRELISAGQDHLYIKNMS